MVLKVLFVIITVSLAALQGAETGDQDWWKTAVFYQIYPRSFKDSNNDGVGDLQGVIQKLDHFVDIGINAVWLSPIYKSPQKDHGYDISDFRDIDPIFGTLEDFDELQKAAHSKGLKVILDFVPNHSSDEHEWFIRSENGEEHYKDFYVWLDGKNGNKDPPNNWISYFHGSAWTFSEKRQQWYLHQFHSGQPDLNYRDPNVVQEMKDVLTYWLDKGADGFRVDTIPSLVEVASFPDEPLSGDPNAMPEDHEYLLHPYTNDQPETYEVVYQWRALLDAYVEEHGGDARVMMTESYSDVEHLFLYYGNETHNGAHFSFNFWFISELDGESNAYQIRNIINFWFNNMPSKHTANWVLGNHDRPRLASRYGTGRSDGLIMLAAVLPGVSVTYNGEEIGMENGEVTWEQGQDPQACQGRPEDYETNTRDLERTPYQWDATVNAGFNEGHDTWLPVSPKYLDCNLEDQKTVDSVTHYKLYKDIVKLRQESTLQSGSWQVEVPSEKILILARSLENEPTYTLIINIGDSSAVVDVKKYVNIADSAEVEVTSVLSKHTKGDAVRTNSVNLGPYDAIVLKS